MSEEKVKYKEGQQDEMDRTTEGKERCSEPGSILKYSEKSFGTGTNRTNESKKIKVFEQ